MPQSLKPAELTQEAKERRTARLRANAARIDELFNGLVTDQQIREQIDELDREAKEQFRQWEREQVAKQERLDEQPLGAPERILATLLQTKNLTTRELFELPSTPMSVTEMLAANLLREPEPDDWEKYLQDLKSSGASQYNEKAEGCIRTTPDVRDYSKRLDEIEAEIVREFRFEARRYKADASALRAFEKLLGILRRRLQIRKMHWIERHSDYWGCDEAPPGAAEPTITPSPADGSRGHGGRPRRLDIESNRVRKLRGDLKQEIFTAPCGISPDTLHDAEKHDLATMETLRKICKHPNAKAKKIRPKYFLKIVPQKPEQ